MLEELRVCFMVLYFDNSSYLSTFVLLSSLFVYGCVFWSFSSCLYVVGLCSVVELGLARALNLNFVGRARNLNLNLALPELAGGPCASVLPVAGLIYQNLITLEKNVLQGTNLPAESSCTGQSLRVHGRA